MRRHLRSCRCSGRTLGETDRNAFEPLDLVVVSLIERSWSFCALSGDAIERAAVRAEIVLAILGVPRREERLARDLT